MIAATTMWRWGLLLLTASSLSGWGLLAAATPPHSTTTGSDIKAAFRNFILAHQKHYSSEAEYQSRFTNFQRAFKVIEGRRYWGCGRLAVVADFGRREKQHLFHVSLNHLADLHDHEVDMILGGKMDLPSLRFTAQPRWWRSPKTTLNAPLAGVNNFRAQAVHPTEKEVLSPPPESVDWSSSDNPLGRPVIVKPLNQGHCGACWGFVAVTTVEAAVAINTGLLTPLSIQELIDCDTLWNAGCGGGNPILAFDYIRDKGLTTQDSYPYTAKESTCAPDMVPVSSIEGYELLRSYDEDALKEAVARQPVAVGISGKYSTFLFYAGGVYDDDDCGTELNHAVVIVGYGHDEKSGKDYWIAKNSWGPRWGEGGFIRLLRKSNVDKSKDDPGMCGLATAPSVPVGAYGGNTTGLVLHAVHRPEELSNEVVYLGAQVVFAVGVLLLMTMAASYFIFNRGQEEPAYTHIGGSGMGVYCPIDDRVIAQQQDQYPSALQALSHTTIQSPPSGRRPHGAGSTRLMHQQLTPSQNYGAIMPADGRPPTP